MNKFIRGVFNRSVNVFADVKVSSVSSSTIMYGGSAILEGDAETECDGLALGEESKLGLLDGDELTLGEADALGLELGLELSEADGLELGLELSEADGLELSEADGDVLAE